MKATVAEMTISSITNIVLVVLEESVVLASGLVEVEVDEIT